ncbi:hypothetical protein [Allorhizobium taibaishanense]|uniref:Uncharacterized protein n=1 Tax=Allorhizobium taibaishanense TaxID=887144 RepID=A0A1Q9A2Z5_9HYPH|nr:hypothetical protein [Allorhizobium taibaishanense]MBB4005956.1 hypothetical protein [Allorhizobium taibaishanense]OLP48983.1 hypothetical protein BJF91_17855 [Allorhizobium taibaishanense]
MPKGGKNDVGKTDNVSLTAKSMTDKETFGEALSNEGFVPANVGRKIVSEGKRRETLKKKASTNRNK